MPGNCVAGAEIQFEYKRLKQETMFFELRRRITGRSTYNIEGQFHFGFILCL